MLDTPWTDGQTTAALAAWDNYQRKNDVSSQRGRVAGIDPISGRVWFGESARDIAAQMDAEGAFRPLYFVRVGFDYYLRKGTRR